MKVRQYQRDLESSGFIDTRILVVLWKHLRLMHLLWCLLKDLDWDNSMVFVGPISLDFQLLFNKEQCRLLIIKPLFSGPFIDKVKAMVFSSSQVCMWELHHKEGEELMLSNCGAGEDSWESLGLQETKSVIPKGNQPWILRTDAEAPVLWLPDVKSCLIGKNLDAGKYWGKEETGATEDKRVE